MIKAYLWVCFLTADIAEYLAAVDEGSNRIVDAFKCTVAFSAHFSRPGAHDCFAVEYDINAVYIVLHGETQAVQQILFRVCHRRGHRLLRTSEDNRFGRILHKIGQRRCRVGHGVGAVSDDKSVVICEGGFDFQCNTRPVFGLYIGAVDVEKLTYIHFTECVSLWNIR